MIKEYTYRETYITFLLIGDKFKVSKLLREKCGEWGMDEMFDVCVYIAKKFIQYDDHNYETMSLYDSFDNFLYDHDKEIVEYIENGTEFEIKGE